MLLALLVCDGIIAQEVTHPLAREFERCPEGHTELKDIPIIYGLIGPLYKEPEDYDEEDKALVAKQKRGEVVFGGDILYGKPAKSQVTCQSCGFYFDSDWLDSNDSSWVKFSERKGDFKRKLSKWVQQFPLLEGWNESVYYMQVFGRDGKSLQWETLHYRSKLNREKIKEGIRIWMEEMDLNSSEFKRWKSVSLPAMKPGPDPFGGNGAAWVEAGEDEDAQKSKRLFRDHYEVDGVKIEVSQRGRQEFDISIQHTPQKIQ